jgi:hypothetical protein
MEWADINGDEHTVTEYPNLAIGPGQEMWLAKRHRGNGPWRSSVRYRDINGTWQAPFEVYFNGILVDFVRIAYSTKSDKLYATGRVQKNPYEWGFAESLDKGKSWTNYVALGTNTTSDTDVKPKIVTDASDNIWAIANWNGGIMGRSRINGTWTPMQIVAPGFTEYDWTRRFIGDLTTDGNGYAYTTYDTPKSFGLSRFSPGTGWQVITTDGAPGSTTLDTSVCTTSDGRVWVALGYGGDNSTVGSMVVTSPDRGVTFGNPVLAVRGFNDIKAIRIRFFDGKVYVITSFGNPRSTYYACTS